MDFLLIIMRCVQMSCVVFVFTSVLDHSLGYVFHADPEKDQAGIDHVTLLLTLSVFLVSCPPEVVNAKNLLEPCLEVFSSAWDSNNPTVSCVN